MQRHKGLTIQVHPIIYTYLTSGLPSIRLRWTWKYKQKIKVKANAQNHLTEFRFFDDSEEEIKI
jgi:ribonuclease G